MIFNKNAKGLCIIILIIITVLSFIEPSIVKGKTVPFSIDFANIDHSPLVEGDRAGITISVSNAEKVTYKIILKDESSGKLKQLLYAKGIDGSIPYVFTPDVAYKVGKYSIEIYAIRESDNVSTYCTIKLNCVNKDKRTVYTQVEK
jgi:hypothetical protein